MGKSTRKNSNYKKEKNTTAEQKSRQIEILSFAFTIAGLLLALFDIVDKPSISFRRIAAFLLMLSSATGIIFSHHKYAKCVTTKKKIVQYGTYLIWGSVFVLGAVLLISDLYHQTGNQDNIPQQFENYESLGELYSTQQPENDEQQLLMQAELYYNGEEYGSVIDLYSSETLKENPIVLNNLGYMYSKGIYFEQNFDVAIQYYENASKKGLDDALHNLISLKLHNCTTFQEVVDVLRTGYDSSDGGTFLFLGSILENKDLSETQLTDQEQNWIKTKILSFFDADDKTQAKILSESLGPWKYKTIISDNVTHGDGNIFEKYTFLTSGYEYNGCGIKRTYKYSYNISTRTFLYDNLMEEYFVSVIDPEQLVP